MRIKSSFYNSITAVISSLITMIIGLVVNKIFLQYLGTEYLGLNGLFTNIISMLSVAEMGIGSAIIFSLYKPIAENDVAKIKSLMNFYKKCYIRIAIVIASIGILIIPMLKLIVKDYNIPINMYIVYAMFLIESVVSYLLIYKRSIIYANQKNYIINIVHIGYSILMNLFCLLALCTTKSYYLFLLIKIVFRILENLIVSKIAEKKYSYLREKNVEKLDDGTYKEIIKKVKALVIHQVVGFTVKGLDNIIISTFFGLTAVGLCSNYTMLTSACATIGGQILASLTASIGNLLVENNKEKSYDIYKKIYFMDFCLATFLATGLMNVANDFITVWIGKEYLYANVIVFVFVLEFFYRQMRSATAIFKEAAGICYEDRFVPIIEALVNAIASIIFLKIAGIAGVFIGTILSQMVIHLYSYPKFVFKKLFSKELKEYYSMFVKYSLSAFIIGTISYILCSLINISNIYLNLIVHAMLTILITMISIYIVYRKQNEYIFFKGLIIKALNKIIKKKVVAE